MKNEGRNLVSEAVNDAKELREAALDAAKNELIEQMAPAIRSLVEKNLKGVLDEKRGVTGRADMSQRAEYLGSPANVKFQEGEDKMSDKDDVKVDENSLDLESIASFFPPMAEEPEQDGEEMAEDPTGMMSGIPMLGEGEDEEEGGEEKEEKEDEESEEEAPVKEAKKKDDEEDDAVKNEEIEIDEAELRKVYEAALQTEVQVKKGFGDMTKTGELDDVSKDVDKGLADVKKGEHTWEKEEPPAKQDFTVKEMKELIEKGLAENRNLKENLKKAVEMIKQLGTRLHEVNLFNAKVLHVNSLLSKHPSMTNEQKKGIIETIDKAKTIDEVRLVFEAVSKNFVSGKLSESRKPSASAQRARTSGGADQKVLRESVDRQSNQMYDRWAALAGIVNGK